MSASRARVTFLRVDHLRRPSLVRCRFHALTQLWNGSMPDHRHSRAPSIPIVMNDASSGCSSSRWVTWISIDDVYCLNCRVTVSSPVRQWTPSSCFDRGNDY